MRVHAIPHINMPYGAAHLINKILADPRCTTDHILITADALDATANDLPPDSHFSPTMRANAVQLRQVAHLYAQPRGNKLGDFDGSLSP
jgi:hypothetical protein